MTSGENSKELDKAVKAIAAVIGLMIAVFALLGIFLPTSLTQPIGALIIGLIFTAILVWMGKLEWGRALVTWLVVSIGVIILYLIVSRPASIVGSVVDSSGSPVKGLTLILTDANGVDHKTVSDENGAFEISNVSEGKFTISSNGELLISGRVPSGWKRIVDTQMNIGSPVYRPSSTATVTPTIVAVVISDTPTPTPTVSPTSTPTPILTPSPTPHIIVSTESLMGWAPSSDGQSSINVSLVQGRTNNAVGISYDVTDAGYVIITKGVDPKMLSGTMGISFYYRGSGAPNTIEFKLMLRYPGDTDDTTYGVRLHKATATGDNWTLVEVPYSDFACWWPSENCQKHPRLDLTMVLRMDFAISNKSDFGDQVGSGWVAFEDVVGIKP